MADFNPLFKPADKPRWQRPSVHALMRAQFNIETFLLVGAVLQSLLTLLLPLRLAFLPAVLFLLAKIASAYAVNYNLLPNPHMLDQNITTKFSAQLPSPDGFFGSTPARSPLAVFLIGARNNSPLGIANPQFKAMGDLMDGMIKQLEANPTETGFMGATNWMGTERASNAMNMSVMYFRSAADVHAFAHGPLHRQAWDWWYKNLKANEHLSIFHELYEVPSGNYESVYAQMPPTLLAATQHRVVTEEGGRKKEGWTLPVVDARKGQLKSSKGRMARSEGREMDGYGIQDIDEDVKVEAREVV
ncbi:hypothetical protein KVT40_005389 [Elsinoe batatas]|uniref:Monooxygenase n=1 Tax=Elsinoe batatas TaxID=2601811 RepID=A0A8K0PIA8_9PEZI|nr:hypothetical protein KVT40_005389 [Elsinoe batatas]